MQLHEFRFKSKESPVTQSNYTLVAIIGIDRCLSYLSEHMHHLICPGRPSAHIRTGQHPLRSYRYWFLMITKTVTTIRNQVSTGAVKQSTAIMFRQRAIFTKTRASL